ncbi:MAG TPA: alpha/beta fold hydrolase [Smithellaceae bacterium]|nr:alpha/beta fold hydrolase [Smithellaceae bacterium]
MVRPDKKIGNYSFKPSLAARSRHIQSIMASSRLRLPAGNPVEDNQQELIITVKNRSRLLAFYSRNDNARGLMIIIHGWEGSSSSAYVLSAGNRFYQDGFSVCRLNLHDHGESHHLNENLFHGAMIEETFDAVRQIAGLASDIPCYLLGFSLGGNFALRIAAKNSAHPIDNLQHVFAVSPPLDPYKTTLAIDNGYSFYRRYFLKKWKRSLAKKQQLFPGKYDFRAVLEAKTCIELTEAIMVFYPELPYYRDYFNLYTLKNDFFQNFRIPVTVIISRDDPVIPVEDFINLQENDFFELSVQNFGGHCGFLDFFPLFCWHEQQIAEIIKSKK